jgi:hypothetical protein
VKNQKRGKLLKRLGYNQHVGPLEKCLECKGIQLIRNASKIVDFPKEDVVKLKSVKKELPPADEVVYCKIHPEVESKRDALGRWMGYCRACLVKRGKEFGEKNFKKDGFGGPMKFMLPLNTAKHKELKEWLTVMAEENERTFHQEIVYRLRQAMKEATGVKTVARI